MKNLVEKISAIITAAVVLVIGILCIVANSAEEGSAEAFEGISLTLGIVFIIVAALALVFEIVLLVMAKGGLLLKASAISSGVLLALGIFFVTNKTAAGTLLAMFLEFVPYVMIVVGSLLVLDAIFTLVFGLIKKEKVAPKKIKKIDKTIITRMSKGADSIHKDTTEKKEIKKNKLPNFC